MINYFKSKGLSDCGIAGLLGNLYAESRLDPQALQLSYSKMTKEEYIAAVDSGDYSKEEFIHDKVGFGLAQWTFWSRKLALYDFCKAKKESIGSLQAQLDFLYIELTTTYSVLWKKLKETQSILEASNLVLFEFEKPADQSKKVQKERYEFSKKFYNQEVNNMTNSPLATYTRITNHKTPMTNKVLNRISIHCFVGQTTAKQGVDYFATTDRKSSCNYIVGYDGSIGLCVDEKDRSWCTSSADNDCQAITIEVASDKTDPYKVTDKAYAALLDLVTDICKRNNKDKVIWIDDKDKALSYAPAANEIVLTVHRWFAKKACPGAYLLSKHPEIASIVTERLNEEEEEMTQEQFNTMMDNYLAEISALPATWEKNAMDWAESIGLMSGNNKNQLMPKRFMTRGELATVLKRYSEMSDK